MSNSAELGSTLTRIEHAVDARLMPFPALSAIHGQFRERYPIGYLASVFAPYVALAPAYLDDLWNAYHATETVFNVDLDENLQAVSDGVRNWTGDGADGFRFRMTGIKSSLTKIHQEIRDLMTIEKTFKELADKAQTDALHIATNALRALTAEEPDTAGGLTFAALGWLGALTAAGATVATDGATAPALVSTVGQAVSATVSFVQSSASDSAADPISIYVQLIADFHTLQEGVAVRIRAIGKAINGRLREIEADRGDFAVPAPGITDPGVRFDGGQFRPEDDPDGAEARIPHAPLIDKHEYDATTHPSTTEVENQQRHSRTAEQHQTRLDNRQHTLEIGTALTGLPPITSDPDPGDLAD